MTDIELMVLLWQRPETRREALALADRNRSYSDGLMMNVEGMQAQIREAKTLEILNAPYPRLAWASAPEYVEDDGDDCWDGYEAWLAEQPDDEDAYIAWMDEMSAREEMPEAEND